MKRFYKHREIKTTIDGVFVKIEGTPQDARSDDVANNFYIGYLIDRRPNYIPEKGTAVYAAELKTFSSQEIRELLGIKPKERTYWE